MFGPNQAFGKFSNFVQMPCQVLRYKMSELQETGGGVEMQTVEAAERNWNVSLHRVKTWPQLMCCALV